MAASIRFNGVVGPLYVAAGTVINLSNFSDAGVLGWEWTLLDRPSGSAAAISTPNASTSQFTADVSGTYFVRLITYTDVARTVIDDADRQITAVRFAVPYDWRKPAAGERTEADPTRGWATALEEIIDDLRAFVATPAVVTLQNAFNGGPTIELGGGTLLVQQGGTGVFRVLPNQAQAHNGTSLNPSWSFINQQDMGMYRVAINTLGFATETVLRLQVHKDGITAVPPVLLSDGAVGAPGAAFSGDPNTGIWRIGSGVIGVSGDGLEVARFQAPAGANPQALFASGSQTHPSIAFSASTGDGFYYAAGPAIAAGGLVRWRWQSNYMQAFTADSRIVNSATHGQLTFQGNVSTGTSAPVVIANALALTAAAGIQKALGIEATMSQTGTGGYCGIEVAITESGLTGSGTRRVIDTKVGGSSVYYVTSGGSVAAGYHTFVGDLTSGFQSGGAAVINVYLGNVNQWRLSNAIFMGLDSTMMIKQGVTGAGMQIQGNVGTAATPSITFNNDQVFSGASGVQRGLRAAYAIGTSGTAGFTGMEIDLIPSGGGFGGSGEHKAIDVKNNSVTVGYIDKDGRVNAPIVDYYAAAPGTVSSTNVRTGVWNTAGRPPILAQKDATFGEKLLGFDFADRWHGYILPSGTGTPHTLGVQIGTSGTVVHGTLITTSIIYSQQRTRLVTAAAAGSSATVHTTAGYVWRGNAAGRGGFIFHARWIPNGALVAQQRAFIGLTSAVAAIGNVDPSSLTEIIGFGYDSADSNVYVMHNDAAGTATKVDTGISARSALVGLDVFLIAPPNGGNVTYYVSRMDGTAGSASGTISTDLPTNTQALAMQAWVNSGPTASAAEANVMRMVLEQP